MAILSTVILVAAIAWAMAELIGTRRKRRNDEIVMPPRFAATLVFILCIVIVTGASAFHLLWLFPLSFVLGISLLLFPASQKLVMACLGLLAGLKGHHEP
jgi:hypothetical protein